jgi:uncharacterized protein YjbJ (UPF0337 family)
MDSDRIEGSAKEIGGKIEELAGKAIDHEETRADGVGLQIEGKAQNLYGQAKDNLRDAGDRAERALRQTGNLAEQVLDEGQHHARRASDAVEGTVTDHPARALLLALSAGFLVGVLFRRA